MFDKFGVLLSLPIGNLWHLSGENVMTFHILSLLYIFCNCTPYITVVCSQYRYFHLLKSKSSHIYIIS